MFWNSEEELLKNPRKNCCYPLELNEEKFLEKGSIIAIFGVSCDLNNWKAAPEATSATPNFAKCFR